MKKVIKKIFNIIIDVIVIAILLVSIMVVAMSITSGSSGVPNLFGYAPLNVSSNSMEPTLMVNDLIFSKVQNDALYEYEVGDIVTFYDNIENTKTLNTHRIVEVVNDGSVVYYRTQGDNKKTNPVPDTELKKSTQIVAKYTGKKISGIGAFFGFIRTQLGFFLVILLPMIIFFVYEAIRVIMNIIAYNKEKAVEAAQETIANSDLTEEQKRRAIEEYLAQQNGSQNGDPTVQTPADGGSSDAES